MINYYFSWLHFAKRCQGLFKSFSSGPCGSFGVGAPVHGQLGLAGETFLAVGAFEGPPLIHLVASLLLRLLIVPVPIVLLLLLLALDAIRKIPILGLQEIACLLVALLPLHARHVFHGPCVASPESQGLTQFDQARLANLQRKAVPGIHWICAADIQQISRRGLRLLGSL